MKKLKEMTFEEKMLSSIICDAIDEFIGGFENMTYDESEEECEKYWPLKTRTKEYVCGYIYGLLILGDSKYIQSSMRNICLERKHLKFMGNAFIKDLIEKMVELSYTEYGWNFANNYAGDLK